MNKNYNWKQLSSKTVFEQSWFKTKVDVCQLPDGRIFDSYFTVEVPNWCNAIIITEDEKMVLVKQYRGVCQTSRIRYRILFCKFIIRDCFFTF